MRLFSHKKMLACPKKLSPSRPPILDLIQVFLESGAGRGVQLKNFFKLRLILLCWVSVYNGTMVQWFRWAYRWASIYHLLEIWFFGIFSQILASTVIPSYWNFAWRSVWTWKSLQKSGTRNWTLISTQNDMNFWMCLLSHQKIPSCSTPQSKPNDASWLYKCQKNR